MKTTKLVSTLGWLCIVAGLSLSFIPDKALNNRNNSETQGKVKTISTEIDPYKQGKLCLREMLYHEARNTSYKEKLAILDVALNRYRSSAYPDRICEVIKQSKQFSYRNSVPYSKNILPKFQEISSELDKAAYIEISEIVQDRFKDGVISNNKVLPRNALFYHTKNIKKPYWTRSKKIKEVQKDVDKKFLHRYYTYIN